MNYTKKFQDIGFSEEEAKIYLAVLSLGMAKVSDISKEADIPRTSVYNHLKRLIKDDYIKKTKSRGVEYFIVSDPINIFDSQKEKIENFSKIIPLLEKMAGLPGKRPNIEFSDVKKGMLNINNKILEVSNKKYPVYAIESGLALESFIGIAGWEFLFQLQKKINKTQVPVVSMFTDDALPHLKKMPSNMQEIFSKRLPSLRLLKKIEFPFEISMFLLYPRHVFILVPQDLFTINIENVYIYHSLKVMFLELYKKTYTMNTKEFFDGILK